jgi:hypothetical protein
VTVCCVYPMPKIVCELYVAGERQGEGVIELKNFEQFISLDNVEVAVSQRPDIGRRLDYG